MRIDFSLLKSLRLRLRPLQLRVRSPKRRRIDDDGGARSTEDVDEFRRFVDDSLVDDLESDKADANADDDRLDALRTIQLRTAKQRRIHTVLGCK